MSKLRYFYQGYTPKIELPKHMNFEEPGYLVGLHLRVEALTLRRVEPREAARELLSVLERFSGSEVAHARQVTQARGLVEAQEAHVRIHCGTQLSR